MKLIATTTTTFEASVSTDIEFTSTGTSTTTTTSVSTSAGTNYETPTATATATATGTIALSGSTSASADPTEKASDGDGDGGNNLQWLIYTAIVLLVLMIMFVGGYQYNVYKKRNNKGISTDESNHRNSKDTSNTSAKKKRFLSEHEIEDGVPAVGNDKATTLGGPDANINENGPLVYTTAGKLANKFGNKPQLANIPTNSVGANTTNTDELQVSVEIGHTTKEKDDNNNNTDKNNTINTDGTTGDDVLVTSQDTLSLENELLYDNDENEDSVYVNDNTTGTGKDNNGEGEVAVELPVVVGAEGHAGNQRGM